MITLQFEQAWDKTIAPQDREIIKSHFQYLQNSVQEGIHFSFLKEATNHKGELLVTVLLFNNTETNLLIENTGITYQKEDEPSLTATFTLPISIEKKTAVPWTFIFSEKNIVDAPARYMIDHSK